eukprot:CAMPEP_0184705926 /NCGR_PEP_ID=MMETSP0313-20130426/35980_1 /TAXON_ID=2792 /ORGANISM="Porphyridium aerugineum, Strain SAG 1380-2" /LENGTH=280 /DNA_ID=CAMNT_0027167405 /DNA_START=88 /DNA_END=930 /DNA_ORIENTATION=+
MPPKGPNKKDLEKQKQKLVEEKTFGLKNKGKSKKVQQYVQQVNQQADQQVRQKITGTNKSRAQLEAEAAKHQSKKELLEARLKELEILGQVVDDSKKPKTKEQLAKEEEDRKRREEEEERRRIALLPVEDQIEIERERIVTKTPVTLELFLAWKKKKAEDRIRKNSEFKEKRTRNLSKAEKAKGVGMTGKDLFAFNAQVFVDDEEAIVDKLERDENYVSDEEEEQEQQASTYLGGDNDETKNDDENQPADQVDSSAFEALDIKEDENQEQAVEADESLFA